MVETPEPCEWMWYGDGIRWLPNGPHECPPFQSCAPPDYDGVTLFEIGYSMCA